MEMEGQILLSAGAAAKMIKKTPGFQLQCSSFTVIKAGDRQLCLCLLQPGLHIKRRCFPRGQVPCHRIQVRMSTMGRCVRAMIRKSLLTTARTEQVMPHPPRVPGVCGDSALPCFLGSTGSSKGTVPSERTVPGAGGGPLGQRGLPAPRAQAPASTWPPTQGECIPP